MSCLICNDKDLVLSQSSLNLFEGCAKSSKEQSSIQAVSADLSTIFVLRILGISSEFCEYLIFSGGNPSSWGLNFCTACRALIKEANFISEQIRNLIDDYDVLRNKLKDIALSSFKVDQKSGLRKRKKSISEEIRLWFYEDAKKKVQNTTTQELSSGSSVKSEVDFSGDDEILDYSDPIDFDPESDDRQEGEKVEMQPRTRSRSTAINKREIPDSSDSDEIDFDEPHNTMSPEWKPSDCESSGNEEETQQAESGDDYYPSSSSKNSKGMKQVDETTTKLIFKCTESGCCRRFQDHTLLDAHILRFHLGDPNPYYCDLCDHKFRRQVRLLIHKRRCHPTSIDFNDEDASGLVDQDDGNGQSVSVDGVQVDNQEHTDLLKAMDENCNISCDQCRLKIRSKLHLLGHKRTKHQAIKNGFECPICQRGFRRYDGLFEHCQTHLLNSSYVKCTYQECKKVFKSSILRDAHIQAKHLDAEMTYTCPTCSRRFKKSSSLYSHMKIKHNITPGEVGLNVKKFNSSSVKLPLVFKCLKCQLRFPSKLSMETHLRKIHSETKSCTESGCEKKFSNDDNLQRHILYVHTPLAERSLKLEEQNQQRLIICQDCGMEFKKNSNFLIHRRIRHAGPEEKRPFMCEICSKSFTLKLYLDNHQKAIHYEELGINPNKCCECGKIFNNPVSLRNHMKMIHTKNDCKFQCELCPRGFMYEYYLKDHIRIYHNEKKEFKCAECGKEFGTDGYLKRHLYTHRDVKPFNCKVCSKPFSDSSTYKRHMETHGSTIHECPTCGKQFKVRHSFKLHLKTHSSDLKTQKPRAKVNRIRKQKQTPQQNTDNNVIITNVSEDNAINNEPPQDIAQGDSTMEINNTNFPIPALTIPSLVMANSSGNIGDGVNDIASMINSSIYFNDI